MRKSRKYTLKMLPLLMFLLLFSVFKTCNIFSISDFFVLEDVAVLSKSDTVSEDNIEVRENKIFLNSVQFHKVGDYIKCSVKVKNNQDKYCVLKSITDDNKNEYISYTYDKHEGMKLNPDDVFDFIFTETYSKELEDITQRNQNFSVNFYLTFETSDGEILGEKIELNNQTVTGDDSDIYIIVLLIVCVLSMYLFMRTSGKKFFILFIGICMVVLSQFAKSFENQTFKMTFENNVELKDKLVISLDINGNISTKIIPYNTRAYIDMPYSDGETFIGWQMEDGSLFDENSLITDDIKLKAIWDSGSAMFISGKRLNVKMKSLAGNSDAVVESLDNEIVSVVRSLDTPPENIMNEEHIVSTDDSPDVIYMWYENGTIYYYSGANYIYLNPISESLFEKFGVLKNVDTNNFHTEKVTNMAKMFYGCTSLENVNVSKFRTENVTSMFGMFSACTSLKNIDLSSFHTDKVRDMSSMFNQCNSLEYLDVSSFDTSNVRNMNRMFTACNSLDSLDLSNFRTGNVTDMAKMFDYTLSIKSVDISNFDTNNVIKMNCMFRGCSSLERLDLTSFSISSADTIEQMFEGCASLTSISVDATKFGTNNAKSMKQMFYNCSKLEGFDYSALNTGNVTNMSGMFSQCTSIGNLDLSGFDTHNVTDMSNMFNNCSSADSIDVSNFDTSSVKSTNRMFSSCRAVQELDVSSFNTAQVTNMEKMFDNMTNVRTIYASENFSTVNVERGSNMFVNDVNLVGGNNTAYNPSRVGYTYARIDTEGFPGYFTKRSA